jgi:hypothetical protein
MSRHRIVAEERQAKNLSRQGTKSLNYSLEDISMVFKVVFQIFFDQSKWEETWAKELRTETPGNPHDPHIKIYANPKDAEGRESHFHLL